MTRRRTLPVRAAVAATACVGLVMCGPVLSRVAPTAISPAGWFAVAVAACFAAMAVSLDVVAGHAGQLTLGHGAVISVGAVASGVATAKWHLPFVAGICFGTAASLAISWVLARPAVRLGALSLGAVTLATAIAVERSLFRWDWLTAGQESMVLPRPLAGSFRFSSSADYAAIAVAVAGVLWFVDRWVGNHRFGRALHVIRDDERLAQALGISPEKEKHRAFALAGAMAGVAGATYGHLLITVGSDTFGFDRLSLPLLALVVIGGQGSAGAVAAAGAAYGLLPRIFEPLEAWAAVVSAILFLHAVSQNPEGLAHTIRRRRRRRRHRRSPDSAPAVSLAAAAGASQRPPALRRPTLVLSDVSVRAGQRLLLEEVSLVVPPATIVALVGANGAGKTTALNAVSGFVDLAAGSIRLDDRVVSSLPAHDRRRCGIVRTFQGSSLPARISVEEALLLHLPGHERSARREARRLASAVALDHRLDAPVRELSVGEQRLVELAGVLSSDADILLLDEPSAGLSPPAVEELSACLASARDARALAVLLVEHDLALVRAVADVVVVLDRGRIVHEGPAEEVFEEGPEQLLAWVGGTSI